MKVTDLGYYILLVVLLILQGLCGALIPASWSRSPGELQLASPLTVLRLGRGGGGFVRLAERSGSGQWHLCPGGLRAALRRQTTGAAAYSKAENQQRQPAPHFFFFHRSSCRLLSLWQLSVSCGKKKKN